VVDDAAALLGPDQAVLEVFAQAAGLDHADFPLHVDDVELQAILAQRSAQGGRIETGGAEWKMCQDAGNDGIGADNNRKARVLAGTAELNGS